MKTLLENIGFSLAGSALGAWFTRRRRAHLYDNYAFFLLSALLSYACAPLVMKHLDMASEYLPAVALILSLSGGTVFIELWDHSGAILKAVLKHYLGGKDGSD